jgi:hypothetical protein
MRSKVRHYPYLTRESARRFNEKRTARGVTESAAFQAAVDMWVGDDPGDHQRIIKSQVRLERSVALLSRKFDVLAEGFKAFVQFSFAALPQIPEGEREAAARLRDIRYGRFLNDVSRCLATGSSLVADVAKSLDTERPASLPEAPGSPGDRDLEP